jgi:hypothetical protein
MEQLVPIWSPVKIEKKKALLHAPNLKPVMIGGIALSLFQTKYGTRHELIDRLHPQKI